MVISLKRTPKKHVLRESLVEQREKKKPEKGKRQEKEGQSRQNRHLEKEGLVKGKKNGIRVIIEESKHESFQNYVKDEPLKEEPVRTRVDREDKRVRKRAKMPHSAHQRGADKKRPNG